MTFTLKAVLVVSAFALAACNDPSRLGGNVAQDVGGAGGVIPGSANDPASIAFFQQSVGDRVLFLVDQSTLNPEGQLALDSQANWLLTNTSYTAVIEGHADEQGTREYNLALGARRADAARNYLISKGIAGNRIRTVTFGKERPAEICSNEECYAKNRRAVTVLATGVTG